MIEFTEDELRYIAKRLLDQPYRALHDVLARNGWIEVCPECMREVWNDDAGDEEGHAPKCSLQIRYAIMDKLDGYYGGRE